MLLSVMPIKVRKGNMQRIHANTTSVIIRRNVTIGLCERRNYSYTVRSPPHSQANDSFRRTRFNLPRDPVFRWFQRLSCQHLLPNAARPDTLDRFLQRCSGFVAKPSSTMYHTELFTIRKNEIKNLL